MPSFVSASSAIKRLVLRRSCIRRWMSYSKNQEHLSNHVTARCLRRVAAKVPSSANEHIGAYRDFNFQPGGICDGCGHQSRSFRGACEGEVGNRNALSRVYEERRVLGYSPEQLFSVVSAVDSYESFLPWCKRSEIIQHHQDGSFDAELEIGFKFLVESYVSHVEFNQQQSIKTTVSKSSLFDHMISFWEFNPGLVPGSCNLYFSVNFKFQSLLYQQMASMFFEEVLSQLVGSFNDRCNLIYGPEIPILEDIQEKSA